MADRTRPALIAGLTGPVLIGLGWMAWAGAPRSYLAINAAALVLALASALWLRLPKGVPARLAMAGAALAAMALPLLIGPELDGVRRWIAFGPLRLHAGYLVLPLLVVLVARMPSLPTSAFLLAALALSMAQPDLATALGLSAAAAALALKRRDAVSLVAAASAAGALSYLARQSDPLEPVRFVEHVQSEAFAAQPAVGVVLGLAGLLPALWFRAGAAQALALGWFTLAAGLAAFIGNYPSILIGYGAAPILGTGLALAALRSSGPCPT